MNDNFRASADREARKHYEMWAKSVANCSKQKHKSDIMISSVFDQKSARKKAFTLNCLC